MQRGEVHLRRVVSKALVSVAVLGLSGTAFAADLPRKAPIAAPVAAPVMNWTGFYIGVQGGYTWGQAQIAHSLIVPVPGLAFAVDTAAVTAASSPDIRLRGWNFGGHIGYNVQFSNWLL